MTEQPEKLVEVLDVVPRDYFHVGTASRQDLARRKLTLNGERGNRLLGSILFFGGVILSFWGQEKMAILAS